MSLQSCLHPSPSIKSILEEKLDREFGVVPGSPLIVAYSGGSDSSALLAAVLNAEKFSSSPICACHVDHGLDPESGPRADRAESLARRLGLLRRGAFYRFRLSSSPASGDSSEAWARARRYELLGRLSKSLGAWILTAHHADDQAETLLVRLLFGTGLPGLSGIRPSRGRLLRPLLDIPRARLTSYVESLGVEPIEDPTNSDCRFPRNRIRRFVLPEWNKREPALVEQLCRVARSAERAVSRIDAKLERATRMWLLSTNRGAALDRGAHTALPEVLREASLGTLERLAGRAYPTSKDARRELLRQLARQPGTVACDAGEGWRWYADSQTLRLLRPVAQPVTDFTYNLRAPGSLDMVEIGLRATVREGTPAPWMFESHVDRVAFSVPRACDDGDSSGQLHLEVRNRRPGDRVQPFGASSLKKLKDVLIDRRAPREERDRIPIFCHGERLVWIPGLTLDETYRIQAKAESVWIIELHSLDPSTVTRERQLVRSPNISPEPGGPLDREKGS